MPPALLVIVKFLEHEFAVTNVAAVPKLSHFDAPPVFNIRGDAMADAFTVGIGAWVPVRN